VSSPADKNAARKSSKLPWILLSLVVLGGAGAGGFFWWQSQQATAHSSKAAAAARAPAQYFALEPAFVVNLADSESVRYLQAEVQLVTRDANTRAAMELHEPAIRNKLLLLFGQQSSAQLGQRTGKERLQASALKEVRDLLKREAAPDKVEAVIFTSLVTQ
jgi:flagellar FliL protein